MSTPIGNFLRDGFEAAAFFRNQLDIPSAPLQRHLNAVRAMQHLGEMQQRIEQLDSQLTLKPDPSVQQQRDSLQFQISVIAVLVERLRRNLVSTPTPTLEERHVAPLTPNERRSMTTTISGTLSQYDITKNGSQVDDSVSAYCGRLL